MCLQTSYLGDQSLEILLSVICLDRFSAGHHQVYLDEKELRGVNSIRRETQTQV